jgi:hypothetical protein
MHNLLAQPPFIRVVASSFPSMEANMRRPIAILLAALAMSGNAHGANCSGSGSPLVLTIDDWRLLPSGAVELGYHLAADKPVTLLQAHVYFEIAGGEGRADANLWIEDNAGLAPDGVASVTLDKPMARLLAVAIPRTVTVYACTNVMEYADGSGVIID